MRNYDLDFLKHFSMVIGFLGLVTIGLILFANHLNGVIPPEVSPTARAPRGADRAGRRCLCRRHRRRLAGRGDGRRGRAAAASQVAYGGTKDGSVIFNNLCTGCHTSGAGGAPTLDKAHWAARIAEGTETLYKHAIEGYNGPDGGIMPPKGGNPALTDDQVKATVDWMLGNLK